MNVIYLSEHYFPRIGGVTTYVKNIVEQSIALFDKTTLIIPSEAGKGKINYNTTGSYTEIQIGVGSELTGNISSSTRKYFIASTYNYLKSYCADEKYDAIHLLYGLYTMQYFDFQFFRNLDIKCGVTIHNIPPAECSISWKGDRLDRYIKDELRKIGVGIINRNRIKKQPFDFYIVPSQHVKKLLSQLLDQSQIHVINHGISSKIQINNNKATNNAVHVLSVGGFVPHKRQDFLIDIAVALQQNGFQLRWTLVGPIRNKSYWKYINDRLEDSKVGHIDIRVSIPKEELAELYQSSDIYVQPSSEEGFCLTALDAAAYGLPIIATQTGALPEIIAIGAGITTSFNKKDLEKAIISVIHSLEYYKENANSSVEHVLNHFKWKNAILQLKEIISRS